MDGSASPMPLRGRTLAVAAGLSLIPAAALVWLGRLSPPWAAWRPATCMPDACFCETLRDSWVRQPANTLSSLAFVFVALLIAPLTAEARRLHGSGNAMTASRVYPALYGTAVMFIGLGSAFYHASLTFGGQTADVLGMYLVATFLLLYNWHRLEGMSAARGAALYVAGNAVLLTLLVGVPALRRWAFAALVLSALYLEWRIRRKRRVTARASLLGWAVGSLALGFALWSLDLTGVLCRPDSPLQGHAAWHLLGAAAALGIYRYYLSEEGTPRVGDSQP